MRTRGLQWQELKPQWSSSKDDDVGTVEELTGQLKEIVDHEREVRANGDLPEEAPAPISKRKTFKELGTPTAQATNHSFPISIRYSHESIKYQSIKYKV